MTIAVEPGDGVNAVAPSPAVVCTAGDRYPSEVSIGIRVLRCIALRNPTSRFGIVMSEATQQ